MRQRNECNSPLRVSRSAVISKRDVGKKRMKSRELGQSNVEVSAIGYGAMSLSSFWGAITQEDANRLLDACLDYGITHIDTADVYGMGCSETLIGDWLRMRKGPVPFTIASKVGITRDPEHRFNNDPKHMAVSLDGSLKRLGLDALDLYYVHRRDTRYDIEEVTDTLVSFKKAGKIKGIGFSEIAPSSLRRASAVHPIDAVQSEYSLSTRSPELGLVQTCAELGTSLVAFSPVGRSLLTNRPHQRCDVEDLIWAAGNPRFQEPNLGYNHRYNSKFCALAREMGFPAASLAIAWLLMQGVHVLPIPGTQKVEHLEELVIGAEISLTDEDVDRIETVLPMGWAHGDRYSVQQWAGPERYC